MAGAGGDSRTEGAAATTLLAGDDTRGDAETIIGAAAEAGEPTDADEELAAEPPMHVSGMAGTLALAAAEEAGAARNKHG